MRVLLTTDTIGGVWTFTTDLVRGLLQQGHTVALIGFGRLPSPYQRAWCLSKKRICGKRFTYVWTDVPLEWMVENTRSYSEGASAILKLAARFNPEIVHTSQFCYGSLPLAIPVVITAHSDVLSWAAACLPNGLSMSPWLHLYKQVVARGLTDTSAVVAPTHWMLAALRRGFAFAAPASVIPNGRSFTLPAPIKRRKLQAVSVGRLWDPAKNIELLRTIRSPLPILIAGESREESLFDSNDHQTPAFLGFLDERELLTLFSGSSIYIVASLYEPFGLAPLEAALCGCAVVANDIPSLREVWGETALYFSNALLLETILNELCRSRELLSEMQARALHRAQELSSTRMAGQYIELYQRLVCTHGSVPSRRVVTHAC